jgi:hypothetical protein
VTVFRRRRRDDEDVQATVEADQSPEGGETAASDEPDAVPGSTGSGPWDLADLSDDDEGDGDDRIDLGALRIRGREGMELRIEVDQQSQRVVAVSCVVGSSAVQVQAFAAPRSEGIWREVRGELADGIVAGGGLADEVDGPFGRELRAQVPVPLPDGRSGRQPVRFVGVDGPRWFLRGAISGAAYDDPQEAAAIEAVFRDIVVVRGDEAKAPRDPLLLRLPAGAQPPGAQAEPDAARPDLNPFARGPEITEIR